MEENSKQKQITIGVIILAVVALFVVTVWQPAYLGFRDPTDYASLEEQAAAEAEAYRKLLASMEPNYAASQQFLEKIATDEIVRQQIEQTLDVNQRIAIPVIANNELKLSDRTDEDFVVNYFTDFESMAQNYNNSIRDSIQSLYSSSGDAISLARAERDTMAVAQNLRGMDVPREAAEMHKAAIISYEYYSKVFGNAKQYARAEVDNPWSSLYGNYSVINNTLGTVNSESERLVAYYNLKQKPDRSFAMIKTAQAQFGFVTVGVDIPFAIQEGIKAGLARSFSSFAVNMIDVMVQHIEKNFAIASQLYYSNDLGRFYSVEYMKKFVSDPLDQDIITKFLPQYFCVNPNAGELKQIFEAKARENVGTDIVINPSDPDFLDKLARLGSDPKNYPIWWEGYYETLAAQTRSEAEAAATKEVLSPGIKTGRDLVNSQVVKTVSAISGVQEAAISGSINLGTNNAENIVSQLVAGVVQNLVDKFVFTALDSGGQGGSIGIIRESNVCLTVPQIKPIVPLPESGYETPEGGTLPGTTTPPFNPR